MNETIDELKMAKKRDHKIMITDEAISKVPRIQYKNISDVEYNNIWELAKNVLHNHPSLSNFSLSDIQFLLKYASVKMMVVVTNLGSISYLVKNQKYDFVKAADYFLKTVII